MRVKREVSGVARHLGKISTLSVDRFKFSNMQICFSACKQLNITLKNIYHYLALFRPWRRGVCGGGRVTGFAHTGRREICCESAEILAAV